MHDVTTDGHKWEKLHTGELFDAQSSNQSWGPTFYLFLKAIYRFNFAVCRLTTEKTKLIQTNSYFTHEDKVNLSDWRLGKSDNAYVYGEACPQLLHCFTLCSVCWGCLVKTISEWDKWGCEKRKKKTPKNKVRQSWQISKQFATPSLIWAANCCFYIHHWGITSLRGSHALFMVLALILDQRGKKYLTENNKSSTLWILFSVQTGSMVFL